MRKNKCWMVFQVAVCTLFLTLQSLSLAQLREPPVAPVMQEQGPITVYDDPGDDILMNAVNLDATIRFFPGGGVNVGYTRKDLFVYLYDPSPLREVALGGLTSKDYQALLAPPHELPDPEVVANLYDGLTTTSNWLTLAYFDNLTDEPIVSDVFLIAGIKGDTATTFSQITMTVKTLFDGFPPNELSGWHSTPKGDPVAGYDDLPELDETLGHRPVGWNTGTAEDPDVGLEGTVVFNFGAYVSGDGIASRIIVDHFGRDLWGYEPGDIGTFIIPHNGVDFDPANPGIPYPAFEVTATIANTAPNPEDSAGYRFGFLNAANTHLGYYTAQSGTEKGERPYSPQFYYPQLNPSASTGDYTFSLNFAVPVEANGMENNAPNPTQIGAYRVGSPTIGGWADGRDYALEFDCIDFEGKFGDFTLESIRIRAFSLNDVQVETSPSLVRDYFTAEDFLAWEGFGYGKPFMEGTVTHLPDGIQISAAPEIDEFGPSIVRTNPVPGSQNFLTPLPDRLIRSTLVCKSEDPDTAPILRLILDIHNYDSNGNLNRNRGYFMEEQWGPLSWTYKRPSERLSGQLNPGVPKMTDTTFTSFLRIQPAFDDPEYDPTGDILMPQIQAYTFGWHGSLWPSLGWPAETGTIDITRFTLETVKKP